MVDFRIDVVVDPSGAVTGSRVVERELNQVQNRADGLRSSLGRVFALLGGGAIVGTVIKTLADFDQSLATVRAVSGATGDEFLLLRDKALELGAGTKFTATEAGNALGDLARAGFSVTESLQAVGSTLLLAQAGGLGLAEATTITTTVLRGFQLAADQAGRVADVLSLAANKSDASVEGLGNGFKFAGSTAASLGVSLETTAAALGILANNGKKGEEGGTGLRKLMSSLLNPTSEALDIFNRLGISTEELSVQQRGLFPVIETLRDKGVGLAESFTIFGDRGGPAFDILKKGAKDAAELNAVLDAANDTARITAAIMGDNLQGSLLKLRASFQSVILAVGNAGATNGLRGLVDGLSSALRFLAANGEVVYKFAQNLALFLGPRYLLGAVRALGLAVAANPLGLILTVIAAIVASIPDFQEKLTGLVSTLGDLGETLSSSLDFAALFGGLAAAIDGAVALFAGLGAASGTVFDAISAQPEAAAMLMKKAFRDSVEAIIDFFMAMGVTVAQIVFGIGKDAVSVLSNVGGAIGALTTGNLEAAQSFADNLTSALSRGANRVATFTNQFKTNLEKLQGMQLLPEVELTAEAADLGALVGQEFQRAVMESKPTAAEALDRLIGRPDELLAESARRAAALAVPPPSAPSAAPQNPALPPSQRANELIAQLDVLKQLTIEEKALNEVLALRPDLERSIRDAMLAAQIAALDTSTALIDGFSRAFLKLKQEANDLAAVAENVVNVFADRATDALVEFARTGEFNFKKFATAILEDLTRILIRLLLVQAISAAFGGGTGGVVSAGAGLAGGGGGRARGGTVQPDRSYMVGENGPELFQPNQSGTIIPAAASAPAPQVNVQVVNVDDPNKVPQSISSGQSDEAIINMLARNKDRVSRVIR